MASKSKDFRPEIRARLLPDLKAAAGKVGVTPTEYVNGAVARRILDDAAGADLAAIAARMRSSGLSPKGTP